MTTLRTLLVRTFIVMTLAGHFTAQATAAPDGTPGDALWAFLHGDYSTAAKFAPGWAERGDATNQAILGWMYVAGKGMPFLPAHGLDWLIKSAEQDNQFAYQFLGSIYDSGSLFAQDEVGALSWLILATRDIPPVLFPDASVVERKRIEKKMTAVGIAEARRRADEWLAMHPAAKRR